jgi:cytochrome d ubiquinol oxidase subunit II
MLRGVSIEVGGHLRDRQWQQFWDVVFAVANIALAIIFGAALGNVIRGVPVDASGRFSLALFSDFGVRGEVGILDWYTLSTAAETLVLLAAHGATYLTLKTTGMVHDRANRIAGRCWIVAAAGFVGMSIETWIVRPALFDHVLARPPGWLAIVVLVAGIAAVIRGRLRRHELLAFAGSVAIFVGLLVGLAVGVFPVLLRSTLDETHSVTVAQAASSNEGLGLALIWWPISLVLAIVYFAFIARQFRGKVRPG